MDNSRDDRNMQLAILILDILAEFVFPLAIKIINDLTSEELTMDKILALRKKVPSIEALEAEMGVIWAPPPGSPEDD